MTTLKRCNVPETNALPNPAGFAQDFKPILPPEPTIIDDTVEQVIPLETGSEIIFRAENIRRERTGIHAMISIILDGTVLAWDTFNISRDGDRTKIANSAAQSLPESVKQIYSKTDLKQDLSSFANNTRRLQVEQQMGKAMSGASKLMAPVFLLLHFIILSGGTILFGPPGRGKSYTAMLMAVSIDAGVTLLWSVTRAKVLYINLERSTDSMKRRLAAVNIALGLPATRSLLFLNARGMALSDIVDAAKATVDKYGVEVVFLDSISRSGLGDLNENSAANRIIDALNRVAPTWLAIAHTPRSDETHVFGSVHFEAGADIMVQMLTQEKDNTLGIGLQITKANDTRKGNMMTFALEFSESGLTAARKARPLEFGELNIGVKKSLSDMVKDYLSEVGEATATEIAKAIDGNRSNISTLLKSEGFTKTRKEGKKQYYGM